MPGRPSHFGLNTSSPYATGLMAAYLAPSGLVGSVHYHDSSLSPNHGTLTNMDPPTDWVWDAELNRFCLGFDGTDGYMAAVKPVGVTYAGPFTISLWAKAKSAITLEGLCDLTGANASTEQICSLWFASGYNGLLASRKETKAYSVKCTTAITQTDWNHIAITAIGGDVVLNLFTNGLPNGTNNAALLTGATTNSMNLARCGGTYYADCFVSDVLVYNRVLSNSEILQLADRSNVMLSGLILPPRRRLWGVTSGGATNRRRRLLFACGA